MSFSTVFAAVKSTTLVCDEVYFIEKRLAEETICLNDLKSAITDYGIWNLQEDYAIQIGVVEDLKNVRRMFLKEQNRVLGRMVDHGMKSSSFLSWETAVLCDRMCRRKGRYCITVLSSVKKLYQAAEEHLALKKQQDNEYYRYLKENRFNYSFLSVDPGKDTDYSTGFEALDVHEYAHQKRNKILRSKFAYTSSACGGKFTPYVEEVKYRNIFLVDKLRSILESFRRLRLRVPAVFRQQYMWENSPSSIQSTYYNHPLSIPIESECESFIPIEELEMIEMAQEADEFVVMEEDPKEVVYPPDYIFVNKLYRSDIENQMDKETPHGACDQLDVEQKENVILTTHAEESVSQPITVDTGVWEKLCSPQHISEYTQLMSRWQRFKTVTWSLNQIKDTNIINSNVALPYDFVATNADSPSCVLFKQYAYFRSDIEVKIVVNSSKFHCGSLQASFYYGAALDQHYKDRENVFSASQLPHVVIDAGCSSDGILKIPYRHYKPLMATSSRQDDNVVLNMGVLRILVLNQLKCPSNSGDNVAVSIFLRFVNPSFHGMKPRGIGTLAAESQMMGMASLVKETANLVQQIYPDNQRDNPTDVVPPKPMVPWNAHSWSIGDMAPEPTNPLRLQATGNTPHPPGTLVDEPEMDIGYMTRTFGLMRILEWTTSMPVESMWKIPFSPILNSYPQVTLNNPDKYTCDVMPPVSVISSLFAYWRGSLEYKLDFIATQFHTGRLIIAFVPRVINSTPTIEQLTHCDHIIVDLREEKQVTYVNGFLSDKPWYPRRTYNVHSPEVYPPGYIYIGIVNPLVAMSSVTDKININIYIRGGPDFEVHIPVAPSIGLSFNTTVKNSTITSNSYLDSYGPPYTGLYLGAWHTIPGKILMRYGPTSDHVTQFPPIARRGRVWLLQGTDDQQKQFKHPAVKGVMKYLVVFNYHGYYYGAPFVDYVSAYTFSAMLSEEGDANNDALKLLVSTEGKADGDYVDQSVRYFWKATSHLDEDFEIVEQGNDERKKECGDKLEVQSRLASTWNGLLTFGEQITSIKQLLRRYQPYCMMYLPKSSKNDVTLADFAFPVMPQGLDLTLEFGGKEYPYGNRMRDGPIPILASGYRFFRGSVRLRFVINTATSGAIWVQHRPEYNLRATKVYSPNSVYADAYFKPGYASLVQFSAMNNVVEVEIPFYLPGQFGMLQRPDLSKIEDAVHYSLGSLFVGVDVPNDKPVSVTVFYSMGDDMTFSVFQGFPPMLDLTVFDVPPKIEEQSGVAQWIRKKMTDPVKSLAFEVMDEAAAKLRQSHPEEDVAEAPDGASLYETIAAYFPELSAEKKILLGSMFTNLVHCAINPSITTIAWSIASILVNAGLAAISFLERMSNSIKRLLRNLLSRDSQQSENESEGVVSQAGDELFLKRDEESVLAESAFVSTCVAGILAVAGASSKPIPKDIPNFAKYLYEGLPKFTLSANGLFTFMKNNIKMFKSIWFWLVSKFKPDHVLYTELAQASSEVVDFLKQIQWSLDSRNADAVRNDPKATIQVYKLANVAQSYLAKRAITSVQKHMPLFDMYCKKIITLRDELTREMLCPAIRFEPFVIGINGPSNAGKSHLAQRLAEEMLTAVNYKTYSELVYTRTPGNAYWNGLKNQPVCLFDDFLNITDPLHAHVSLGELYCLKSKAIFNPPMAAIEEKKLRYNPLLVLLCSNAAFPKIEGLALEEAWMRRRDVLIEVKKVDKYKDIHPRNLPNDIKKTYGHLRFSYYINPAGKTAKEREVDCKWMTFEELNSSLAKKFLEYFDEECIQYDKAIERLKAFYPDAAIGTPEYLAKIEEEAKRINNSSNRVQTTELEQIEQILKDLGENQYRADMTKYVKTKILEKKVAALAGPQPSTIIPAPSVAPSTSAPSTSAASSTSIVSPASAVSQAGIVLDAGYLPDPLVTKVNQCKLIDDLTRWYAGSGLNPTCTCGHSLMNVTRFFNKPNDGGIGYDVSVFKYSSVRFGVKAEDYTYSGDFVPCSESKCMLLDSKFLDYIRRKCVVKIEDCNLKSLPKAIFDQWPRILDSSQLGSIPLMTVDEVDQQLAAEVQDKTWYNKLWESLPGFGTIFSWIVRLSLVVASIGALVRVGGYLASSFNKASASIAESKTTKKYWENNLEIEEQFSGFCAKTWQEIGDKPSQEEAYSAGTIGAKPGVKVPIKAISQASEQQENVIAAKIRRNTFWILAEYKEEGLLKRRSFRCLGLVNRRFIALDHYVYFLLRKEELTLTLVHANLCLELDPSVLTVGMSQMKHSAIMVGTMPPQIPQFADIIKFIMPSSQSTSISPKAALYEYKLNEERGEFVMEKTKINNLKRRNRVEVNNDDGSVTLVSAVYAYPYGGRGVCGSVLVTNANSAYPILGIHIAGMKDGSEGYAEALVRESFDHFYKDVPIVEEGTFGCEVIEEAPVSLALTGDVKLIGGVSKDFRMKPSHKSRQCLTECAGEITPVTYDFPVLSPEDERIKEHPFSPLLEGCKHHTNPCSPMNEYLVQRALDDFETIILSKVQPARMEVGELTLEQSVCGIRGLELYDGIPMDTSEGFPWVKQRPNGATNKSWMFEIDSENRKLLDINPNLKRCVDERVAGRKKGRAYQTIFYDCLKDVKLPKEKALIPGKTRIFSVSPVDFSIVARMFTLDFVVAYTNARFGAEHAIGININSIETNNLVERMLEYGDNNVCGDYAKFGDQLYGRIVEGVFNIIGRWYAHNGCDSEEHQNVIQCLSVETRTAYHLMIDLVYQCIGGMPSGNPLTVVINSMVNSCYIRVAWQEIMMSRSLALMPLSCFHENVRIVTYGDDLWLSVKDEVKDDFNAIHLQKFFSRYNIKFTNATKKSEIVPYTSIRDADTTFLKCTFVKHEFRSNLWMARLDRRAVEEICNWTWTTQKNMREASLEACRSMCEQAFGQGQEYYENLRKKVIHYWLRLGEPIHIPTWMDVDMRIYDSQEDIKVVQNRYINYGKLPVFPLLEKGDIKWCE